MKRLFLRNQNGFTLIELIMVIAIISIVVSFAIPEYMKYQRKAKVSSYAEPFARVCLMDAVAWCAQNPGKTPLLVSLGNCSNTTINTAGGRVTLILPSSMSECTQGGELLVEAEIKATLTGVTDYTAICKYTQDSVKCTIQG